MKFLIDMPVPPRVAAWLGERGHDAVHVAALGMDRAPDEEILDRALSEGRVVLTADTDFPHLLPLSGATCPGVILFRGGNYSARDFEALLEAAMRAISEDTLSRSVCVVDRTTIRCRPLPLP